MTDHEAVQIADVLVHAEGDDVVQDLAERMLLLFPTQDWRELVCTAYESYWGIPLEWELAEDDEVPGGLARLE